MVAELEHPLARRFRIFGERLRAFGLSRERRILGWAVAIYVIVFGGLCAWKLWAFGYGGLDLAIYRQVAAESIRGHLFAFTIHPHSYLGDHVELFFAVLFPLYALVKSPLTLLLAQAFALAIAALPLAKICARIVGKPWHLLLALAFLANPALQNMTLFEFHGLPFAIPLLAFALLAYIERRYGRFLFWSMLALTVREDVALVIIGLGLLALVDRRSWRWSIVPILIGGAWFFAALKLTAVLNGYGNYKFLVYYGWLGKSLGELARNALLQPWRVLAHLVRLQNLTFLLALLLPFAYLPVLRWRWLIPVIPTFIQLLMAQTTGELVAEIHYPALLLPFLLLATAEAFAALRRQPPRGPLRALSREPAMVTILFVVVVVYSMFVAGPLIRGLPLLAQTRTIADRVALEREAVATLPPGGTIASFETITALSDRPRLYSMHYVFLGKKQFSDARYELPADATVALVDLRDFLSYQVLYERRPGDPVWGYARIRTMLRDRGFRLVSYLDRFAIFERGTTGSETLDPIVRQGLPDHLQGGRSQHGELAFLGWSTPSGSLSLTTERFRTSRMYRVLRLDLSFERRGSATLDRQIELKFRQAGKIIYRTLLPLGGGFLPTSEWAVGQPMTSSYRILVPSSLAGRTIQAEVRVLDLAGEAGLNGLRSIALLYHRYEALGPTIELGSVQLDPVTTR